jgi:hypothetical protein
VPVNSAVEKIFILTSPHNNNLHDFNMCYQHSTQTTTIVTMSHRFLRKCATCYTWFCSCHHSCQAYSLMSRLWHHHACQHHHGRQPHVNIHLVAPTGNPLKTCLPPLHKQSTLLPLVVPSSVTSWLSSSRKMLLGYTKSKEMKNLLYWIILCLLY